MSKIKIGVVSAFFPGISVAEIELNYELFVGDHVCFMTKAGEKFLKIKKIIVEDANPEKAEAGHAVGVKTDFVVEVGCEVVKSF